MTVASFPLMGLFGHRGSRGGHYEETEDNLDEIAFHFAPSTVLLLTAVRLLESICEKDNGGGFLEATNSRPLQWR
jgi:hypothetical protein